MEQKALAYTEMRSLELWDNLGFGVDGSVWAIGIKNEIETWAVKFFRHEKPFNSERDCYLRLYEKDISSILGFAVPEYIRHDDAWRAVEMSIVRPPYLLDFAGAVLDEPYDFDADTWEIWEQDRLEKFEESWPQVKKVIREMEWLGIYLSDIHPGNIAFA